MDALALLKGLEGERTRFVGLARRRLRSDADAEDVVQRALERAARSAASIEEPARARAWFYRILRNALADHQRRAVRDPARPGPSDGGSELDEIASEPAESPLRPCRCGVRLLEGLRPSYAEVLRRVDLRGERPSDAAGALGISRGNLEVRLHRARRALREAVKGYCCVGSGVACRDCGCEGERRCGGGA